MIYDYGFFVRVAQAAIYKLHVSKFGKNVTFRIQTSIEASSKPMAVVLFLFKKLKNLIYFEYSSRQ